MKGISKRILVLLFAVIISFSSYTSAYATESILNNTSTVIYNEIRLADNPGATVSFIDSKLFSTQTSQDSNKISPMGVITEVYDHSYYVYQYNTINSYNVGPRDHDTFLLSVARGMTLNLSQSRTISTTLSFSGSVEANMASCIKLGVTGNTSGTQSFTWSTSMNFVGPDAPYNSRSYYAALNYDSTTCYLQRYDVYAQYNGPLFTGYIEYNNGTTSVSGVKIAHAVTYNIDSIQ